MRGVLRVTIADHEKLVNCGTCHAAVLVCGYVDDLPDPYKCLGCRPVKREYENAWARLQAKPAPVAYNEFPVGF